ncbi:hypothetical protein XENOCAPTIV_009225 [Xenoophorus captivus]|uniref:Glycoprotein endo-alpha-1,2-mannosidase n=1 Tax=Xenoophorus captivus TaxID=1517983 RepID=A0ABV0QQV3_9TELE
MARFRLKSCIGFIALPLLVLIITLVLKAFFPEDSPFHSSGEVKVNLRPTASQNQWGYNKKSEQTKMNDRAQSDTEAELESTLRKFPPPNYYLHAFYYVWYGNPRFDGKYIHWDHPQLPHWDAKVAQEYPQGRHKPPDDIGANYYPSLGPYSSRDPSVLEAHMQQLRTAAIEQWAKLLKHTDSSSIRDTPYDGIFIALLVEEKHKREILTAGFDGFYTYFATNGFTYGSTQRNWVSIKAFCDDNDLIFIPSVGPGYIDTSVRPWNFKNTRNRINGKYYETSLSAALESRPDFISITSFNEWHEGTQIETAVPKTGQSVYLDYLPNKPTIYLEITRKWAAIFGGERRRWQD